MCLRYPPLGGINRKAKQKHNETIYFQSRCRQVAENGFCPKLRASTLRTMLRIEFVFSFSGLFLPWVDGMFSKKMVQRQIESNKQLAQILTQLVISKRNTRTRSGYDCYYLGLLLVVHSVPPVHILRATRLFLVSSC